MDPSGGGLAVAKLTYRNKKWRNLKIPPLFCKTKRKETKLKIKLKNKCFTIQLTSAFK